MPHTNDPLLNAKKCWTRAGPNFLPLGWAKKQLCNQFLNTITRSKVAWLSTDIPFLGPVLNYKLPWNWFKRVIINWVSAFVSKLKSPWLCLAFQMSTDIVFKNFQTFLQINIFCLVPPVISQVQKYGTPRFWTSQSLIIITISCACTVCCFQTFALH